MTNVKLNEKLKLQATVRAGQGAVQSPRPHWTPSSKQGPELLCVLDAVGKSLMLLPVSTMRR